MKIASITRSDLSNTAMYRSSVPGRALERRGHTVDSFTQLNGEPRISIDVLSGYDVVHVHRLIVNNDMEYVSKLHDAGVAVCYDNDDDVRSVTPQMWEEMRQAFGTEDGLIEYIVGESEASLSLVPQMDLVTAPSQSIVEGYEALGARKAAIVPNYLPPGIAASSPTSYDGFVIGWHACDEHVWDRRALGIDDMLAKVLDAHRHVHVVTIGIQLELDSSRYERVRHVPLPELFNRIAGFDIGIAPLADIPFNHARSDVKLREYAAVGVPWIASAVGPYLGYGREEGGQLVAADEWFDALDELIRSPFERSRRRRRAKRWAKREHMDRMADMWEGLLLDVVEVRTAA